MSALLPAIAVLLLTAALCVLGVANLLAHHSNRKLIASYAALVAAKDGQLEAYERLIAGQDDLIKAQTGLIRAHEERAVRLGLLPSSLSSWRAPLQ